MIEVMISNLKNCDLKSRFQLIPVVCTQCVRIHCAAASNRYFSVVSHVPYLQPPLPTTYLSKKYIYLEHFWREIGRLAQRRSLSKKQS